MQLGDGIRKVGFRKWYEKALIRSHFYLLTAIVCTVGLLSVFEVFNRVSGADRAFDVLALVLFGIVGVYSMRRYLYLLMHAEHSANQATCAQCKAYGALLVEREDETGARLQVRCKRCSHRWAISTE